MKKFKLFNRDKESAPVGQGVVTGIMEVCYIALVAIFMVGTQSFLRDTAPSAWLNIFGIISMLSLLVLSVGISGLLVFGWPVHYVMERKYEEALSSFLATIASMFVIFAIIFLGASLVSQIRF
ncbi:MAG: hypothetical protein WCT26_04310 [Candidatus Buchananbacteria bacterium]|jgi:hypothetical protein